MQTLCERTSWSSIICLTSVQTFSRCLLKLLVCFDGHNNNVGICISHRRTVATRWWRCIIKRITVIRRITMFRPMIDVSYRRLICPKTYNNYTIDVLKPLYSPECSITTLLTGSCSLLLKNNSTADRNSKSNKWFLLYYLGKIYWCQQFKLFRERPQLNHLHL